MSTHKAVSPSLLRALYSITRKTEFALKTSLPLLLNQEYPTFTKVMSRFLIDRYWETVSGLCFAAKVDQVNGLFIGCKLVERLKPTIAEMPWLVDAFYSQAETFCNLGPSANHGDKVGAMWESFPYDFYRTPVIGD